MNEAVIAIVIVLSGMALFATAIWRGMEGVEK